MDKMLSSGKRVTKVRKRKTIMMITTQADRILKGKEMSYLESSMTCWRESEAVHSRIIIMELQDIMTKIIIVGEMTQSQITLEVIMTPSMMNINDAY
jgi:hypothetical protein